MAKLNIWTQPSGYSLGTFEEQTQLNIALPVTGDSGVTYSIISGSLPGGMYLQQNHIKGTPYLISNDVKYEFCIRATKTGYTIPDRTFTLVVNGASPPIFVTPAGALAAGSNNKYYAVNGEYINIQLEGYDLSPAPGSKLTYFIGSGDGNLPPGLTLTSSGKIYGFTSTALTETYTFTVTLTDGANFQQRTFSILTVNQSSFRADSTIRDSVAGQFTADSTFLKNPTWTSPSNLGVYRANNYITLAVKLLDTQNITFKFSPTNNQVFASTSKLSSLDNNKGGYQITITASTTPLINYYFSLNGIISGAGTTIYKINSVTDLSNNTYRLIINTALEVDIADNITFFIGTLSTLPLGTKFDEISGEIYGTIPYQPVITTEYIFTIGATRFDVGGENITIYKTFSITLLGDITSNITWDSNSNLGTVPAAYISTLNVKATSNVPNATVLYTLVQGTLPPGLTLTLDGELVGEVRESYNSETEELGLTYIDGGATTFDNATTKIDRTYTFTVQASDQFNYSASTKEFSIKITTPNTVDYSNITARPFLNNTQRAVWKTFINDSKIFTPNSIYRSDDKNFGIQQTLSMLVYAGIETREVAAYVGAIGLNHKKKRFAFGNVKKAIAIDPDTQETVYEAVYVELVDPMEIGSKHLPLRVHTQDTSTQLITADQINNISTDSTGYDVSDPNINDYFPNSISNWRYRIKDTRTLTNAHVLSERNYLPLWMRTIQSGSKQQLDYMPAVVLCYCKPGTADDIVLNIKHSGFDFSNLDYTIDRYIIDSVEGYTSDKYLVFKNDRITV
jgi:hypothetical protein